MTKINMLKLSEHTTAEIKAALESCQMIIGEKPPRTLATSGFWKAVENRLKLQRELVVRGEADDQAVALPADRLPLVTIDPSEVPVINDSR